MYFHRTLKCTISSHISIVKKGLSTATRHDFTYMYLLMTNYIFLYAFDHFNVLENIALASWYIYIFHSGYFLWTSTDAVALATIFKGCIVSLGLGKFFYTTLHYGFNLLSMLMIKLKYFGIRVYYYHVCVSFVTRKWFYGSQNCIAMLTIKTKTKKKDQNYMVNQWLA